MAPEAGESLQRPIDTVYSERHRQVPEAQPLRHYQGIDTVSFAQISPSLLEVKGTVRIEHVHPCTPSTEQRSLTQETGQAPPVNASGIHAHQEDGSPVAREKLADLLCQFLSFWPVVAEAPSRHDPFLRQKIQKTGHAGLQGYVQPKIKGIGIRRTARAQVCSYHIGKSRFCTHCSSFPRSWYEGIPGSPVRATSSQHENLLPTQGCAELSAATAGKSMGRRTASALEVPTVPGGQSLQEVNATRRHRPIPYGPGLSSIPGFPLGYTGTATRTCSNKYHTRPSFSSLALA